MVKLPREKNAKKRVEFEEVCQGIANDARLTGRFVCALFWPSTSRHTQSISCDVVEVVVSGLPHTGGALVRPSGVDSQIGLRCWLYPCEERE